MPSFAGLSEKPKPGREGTTTSNESAASNPCAAGSVRRGIISSISAKDPGQPCVRISGMGAGPLPFSYMK
jgi:hypothetical protein